MNNYRTSWSFGGPGMIPLVVRTLLIANVTVFVITYFMGPGATRLLGLVPQAVWTQFTLWQPFTYLFMHGGFSHILFNMLLLWLFGSKIEGLWGGKVFARIYFISGVGAGILNVIIEPNSIIPIIGASGSIYAIIVAVALALPDQPVFIPQLKIKYVAIVLIAMAFLASTSSSGSTVAHLIHLGGAIISYVYVRKFIQGKSIFGDVKYTFDKILWVYASLFKQWKGTTSEYLHYKRMEKEAKRQQQEQDLDWEVDQLLDKINQVGYDNLTKKEKKILNDASERKNKKSF